MRIDGGETVFGQGWTLPPFSWWALLPYAVIVLLLVLYVLGYLRGRGRRPGSDLPAQQQDAVEQVTTASQASNDAAAEDARRRSAPGRP